MIQVTRTVAIDERDLDERFVRASGPGGQNVNKVATAVELRFDIARAALPDEVRTRLRALGGWRVTEDGVLIIDSRAVAKAQELRPDLILLELSMPLMNGLVATRVLKRLMPAVPVLMYSAYGDASTEKEACSAGASAFVSKSEHTSVLLGKARSLLCQIAG